MIQVVRLGAACEHSSGPTSVYHWNGRRNRDETSPNYSVGTCRIRGMEEAVAAAERVHEAQGHGYRGGSACSVAAEPITRCLLPIGSFCCVMPTREGNSAIERRTSSVVLIPRA